MSSTNPGERAAFISYNSTRISYRGSWRLVTEIQEGDSSGLGTDVWKAVEGNGSTSFQVQFRGSGYAVNLREVGPIINCTLDGQSMSELPCKFSTHQPFDFRLGNHILNLTVGAGSVFEGIEYTLPYVAKEDDSIFSEPGFNDTTLWLSANDLNITWPNHAEENFGDSPSEITPKLSNATVSLTFYGTALAFALRTIDMTRWHYTLDDRTVPSRQDKVLFADLCHGTHNLTIRYEIPEGGSAGIDSIQMPFKVSQPSSSSTPRLCDFATPSQPNDFSSTTSDPKPTSPPSSSRPSMAPIIGVAVGGVVALILLLLLGLLLLRRRRRIQERDLPPPTTPFESHFSHQGQLPPEKRSVLSPLGPTNQTRPEVPAIPTKQAPHGMARLLRLASPRQSAPSLPLPKVMQRQLPQTPVPTSLSERYDVEDFVLNRVDDGGGLETGPVVMHVDSGFRIGRGGPGQRIRAGRDVPPEYTDV